MKEILIEQNPHWSGAKSHFVRRKKLDKLIEYLPLRQIITITGIRRCGKSTLAKEAIQYLIDSGVSPKNILFVNLEQPIFLEFKHNPSYLGKILDEYQKLMSPTGKLFVIFDEIQFFDNWQVFIKSKYESSDIKFIITGSNSSMLYSELNTMLSGRSLNIHLDTFSFAEVLDYYGIGYKSEFERLKNKIEIARVKDEYLRWGGFYEALQIKDESTKKELLASYAKNIIYQDIIPRYGIRNYDVVERLFFYLLSNVTGILNYTTLSKIFDISDKSIKEYISYFEDVFLFARIDRYHDKPKEQIKSTKKLYALDNGFLRLIASGSQNLGAALENLVYLHLKNTNEKVYYLKDRFEVDFCVQNSLYQVSYDISDEKTKKREFGAFEHFKTPNTKECTLITFDTNEEIGGVRVVSYDNFVLGGL